ncbi:MAG: hypothetical protein IT307_08190, partial [Chloroflexi bacterium]|nr:hypothetical protein [Chloroflexota bacterium]
MPRRVSGLAGLVSGPRAWYLGSFMIGPCVRRWLTGLVAGLTFLTASVPSAPLGQSPSAAADTPPALGVCPALPVDNVWNARVDSLPVHPRSSSYLTSIGLTTGLKADFGAGLWNGGPIG